MQMFLTFYANHMSRTYVYYNNHAMSKDTRVYKNPETFNPDRYIPKDQGGDGEPFLVGPFGFGRR